jgi:hypothetical protein
MFLPPAEKKKFLGALHAARREAIAAKRYSRPRSGFARCINAMVDEIDAVAELVTGNPEFFHEGGSTRPPAYLEPNDEPR